MKNKSVKITSPFPPRSNKYLHSSFNPFRFRKPPKYNSSHISFPLRLRQFFTLKKFLSIIAAALFGCICRYCLFFYFPDLSMYNFAILFPTSLASILSGAITGLYYDHFLGIGVQEVTKPLANTNYDKFFMNNSGSNTNRGRFNNTILEIWNPIVETYSHGRIGITVTQLVELSRQGRERQLFIISNINISTKSCTITFLKPVPSLNNTADLDLLKKLVDLFPHGNDYSPRINRNGSRLDDYRMQACIRNHIDQAISNPNSIYIANQNKPPGVSPYYDETKEKGYYQPWARDIAYSILRYKRDNNALDNRIILDTDSAIFLATFRNAHNNLSPTNQEAGDVMSALINS